MREIHELYRQRAPYETAVGRTRLGELKRQLRLQVRGLQAGRDACDGGRARGAQETAEVTGEEDVTHVLNIGSWD